MTIWANTIVNNEENFIWFALMSIIDYVDKVLIWDTGSEDKTVEIIKEIKKLKGNKIEFKEVGRVNNEQFTTLRQSQLDESKCDWILILDGDEIWWENSIKDLTQRIKKNGKDIEGIVVPTIVPVGDIYHIQEDKAGQYELLGRKGHFNLRAINRGIPSLHVDFAHPNEAYLDENNKAIHQKENIVSLDTPYLHVTHLKRSENERVVDKFKSEIGNSIPQNFKYPEVLYEPYPNIIKSPWNKISGFKLIKSRLLTPLRKIKRRLIK